MNFELPEQIPQDKPDDPNILNADAGVKGTLVITADVAAP